MEKSRILAVDDNQVNLSIIDEILAEDYDLKTALTGDEALVIASEFRPDLILLDVMMPGMDGCEVCRRFREDAALRYSKIIMVSARAMVSERLVGYGAGADDYLTKPFEEAELLAKVRVFLRLKSVEEVDRLKSDLLTLLSHETRTPLNSILLPAQLLLVEDGEDAVDREELARMIIAGGEQLQRLLDDVLTLSSLRSGQWSFDAVSADLGAITRDTIEEVERETPGRAIEILDELDGSGLVNVDLTEVGRVVASIIDNALRFSDPTEAISVRLFREADQACLSVRDRGKGIDPAFLEMVFDAFTCSDVRHHSSGVGLSMAIAHEIIRWHGGSISVVGTLGEGSTFTMRLPNRSIHGESPDQIRDPVHTALRPARAT